MKSGARRALVTGAASGIGLAIARRLASEGWHLALADLDLVGAERAAHDLGATGGCADAFKLDVAQHEQWEALVAQLRGEWPRLDLLVNAAGNLHVGPIAETSAAELTKLVEVNLLGTMIGTRACLPWLLDSARDHVAPGGGILNIASIFAQVSPPGFAAYNTTKAGIIAWTEALRGELAPTGLKATVILPGVTPTRLFDRAGYPSPAWRAMCDRYLAGAELTPDQVALAALQGLTRGKLYVVVGRRAKLYARLKRLAPEWLIDRVGRLAQRQMEMAAASTIATSESSPSSPTVPYATPAETL